MEKRYGTQIRQDGLEHIGRNKWELFYGFGKDNSEDETGYNYRQLFDHKPSKEEIKSIIIAQINANTDDAILSGFVWNEMYVWLSSDNQFNYKAAYDMAIQTDGKSLPITFKFGTEKEPVYHTFEDLSSVSDFYQKCLSYVQEQIRVGWEEKDGIDWTIFDGSEKTA